MAKPNRIRKLFDNLFPLGTLSAQQEESRKDIVDTLNENQSSIIKSLGEIKDVFMKTDLAQMAEGISREQFEHLFTLKGQYFLKHRTTEEQRKKLIDILKELDGNTNVEIPRSSYEFHFGSKVHP